MVKAYRQGEKVYRAGLLDAGRLCDLYLHQRMGLGDKRGAAVQAVEGQLAQYASGTVDANRLVAVYHAHRLLAEEPGVKAEAVAYGHYRDAWCRLVERQHKDTADECWALLPGLESECKAAFAQAVADTLSKDAVAERVQGLLQRYAAQQAEASAKAKAEAEARAKAAAEAKARQEREQAGRQLQQAERAAERATEQAEKARLQEAADKARAELLAKQEAERMAQAEAEQEARDRERKARERAERGKGKGDGRKAPPLTSVLPAKGNPAVPEVSANHAAEYILEHDDPDSVLRCLLRKLQTAEQLSEDSRHAVKCALVALAKAAARAEQTEAGAEKRNGRTAAAVA